MMKKFLLLLAVIIVSANTHAGCRYQNSVSTHAFHLNKVQTRAQYVWLSNTAAHPVDVSIKVYDQNGSDVSSIVNTTPITQSVAAKGSTFFYMLGNSSLGGAFHAEVSWSSQSCLKRPLLGSMESLGTGGAAAHHMGVTLINQGKEF